LAKSKKGAYERLFLWINFVMSIKANMEERSVPMPSIRIKKSWSMGIEPSAY